MVAGASAPAITPPGDRFLALDALRGVAAIGVMFYHFGDVGLIAGLPPIRRGYVLVDFFFVLSGFVIAEAYGAKLAGGFSRAAFMVLRLGRLYPLHIAIVAAFFALRLADQAMSPGLPIGFVQLLRATLLLDGYWPGDPVNFYNTASWSISVELFAYLLAAVLFGRGRAGVIASVTIYAAAVAAYLTGLDLLVFSTSLQRAVIGFGLGVAAWRLRPLLPAMRRGSPAGLAELAVLGLALWTLTVFGNDGAGLLASDLSFALVVLVFAGQRGVFSTIFSTAPMQALGAWSYSIYMVHLLVIGISYRAVGAVFPAHDRAAAEGQRALQGFERLGLDPLAATALTVAIAVLTVALAALTYRYIEQPGRRWSRRLVGQRGVTPAEAIAPTI